MIFWAAAGSTKVSPKNVSITITRDNNGNLPQGTIEPELQIALRDRNFILPTEHGHDDMAALPAHDGGSAQAIDKGLEVGHSHTLREQQQQPQHANIQAGEANAVNEPQINEYQMNEPRSYHEAQKAFQDAWHYERSQQQREILQAPTTDLSVEPQVLHRGMQYHHVPHAANVASLSGPSFSEQYEGAQEEDPYRHVRGSQGADGTEAREWTAEDWRNHRLWEEFFRRQEAEKYHKQMAARLAYQRAVQQPRQRYLAADIPNVPNVERAHEHYSGIPSRLAQEQPASHHEQHASYHGQGRAMRHQEEAGFPQRWVPQEIDPRAVSDVIRNPVRKQQTRPSPLESVLEEIPRNINMQNSQTARLKRSYSSKSIAQIEHSHLPASYQQILQRRHYEEQVALAANAERAQYLQLNGHQQMRQLLPRDPYARQVRLPQEWSATHSQPQTIRRQEDHSERLQRGISARTAGQEHVLSSQEHVQASQERLLHRVDDPRLLQGKRNLRAPESRADFAGYITSRADHRFQDHESSLGQTHRTHPHIPHTMNASPWAGVSPASFSMPFAEHEIADGAQDGYGSAQYYSLHPDEETVRGDHGRLAQTRGSRVHGSDRLKCLPSHHDRDVSAMYQHGQPYLGNPESTLREQISRQEESQLTQNEPHRQLTSQTIDGSQLVDKRNSIHERSAPKLKFTDHIRSAPEVAHLGFEQELRGARVQADITSPEMLEEDNTLAQNASIEDEALAFAGTMSPERESWQLPASTPQDNNRVVESKPKPVEIQSQQQNTIEDDHGTLTQQQNITEKDHIQPAEDNKAKNKPIEAEVAKPSKPSKPLKEVIKIVGPSASTTAAATPELKRSVGRPRKHPMPQNHEAVTSTKSKKPANVSKKSAVPKRKKGLQSKKKSKKHRDALDEYLGSEDDTESEDDEEEDFLPPGEKRAKSTKKQKSSNAGKPNKKAKLVEPPKENTKTNNIKTPQSVTLTTKQNAKFSAVEDQHTVGKEQIKPSTFEVENAVGKPKSQSLEEQNPKSSAVEVQQATGKAEVKVTALAKKGTPRKERKAKGNRDESKPK